jgi:DNA-binding beta-propeller fold protein YncE
VCRLEIFKKEIISIAITFCSMFCALCSGLFIPYVIYAQTPASNVTYLGSITEDEEGDSIFFPSFVYTEPVKKEIYVIDGKTRIIIFTSDFFPLFTLSKGEGIEMPQGLTVDAEGNLYVAQSSTRHEQRNRISVFNACLKWVRDIYFEGFEGSESFSPYSLATDKKGNIYVAGTGFKGILMLNNQGKLLEIISPEDDGNQVRTNYVTIDKYGKIYIVSEEVSHIYVYDENRKFLFKFGQKGGSTAKLSRPLAVAVDNRDGTMYVVDYMRHTVSAYDKDGKYLFEFGGLGCGEGWFQHPRDIAVDSMGRIFIADTFNNRIEVYKRTEE